MTNLNAPGGDRISIVDGKLQVGDNPILPFIEGDGIGPDIWRSAQHVFDSAVEKAYGGKRKVSWFEVLAGQKAFDATGSWLPDETLDAFRTYLVGIKGPLTTPIGGGIRSLNVALRQRLDLYTCLRPVRWFRNVPSPVRDPSQVDMVIFRENTEDIYAGIEFERRLRRTPKRFQAVARKSTSPTASSKMRFPETQPAWASSRFPQQGTSNAWCAPSIQLRDRQQAARA